MLIPIFLPAAIVFGEVFVLEKSLDEKDVSLLVVEFLVILQVMLTLYLTYIPFYTKSGIRCWDSYGIYVHFVATMLVFLIIPIVVIIHAIMRVSDAKETNPIKAMHCVMAFC